MCNFVQVLTYCTIYAEDNYRLYGPLFRDIHNGGPLENFINEKDK